MSRVKKEEMIAIVDSMYPNTYENKDKVRWIETLEKRIETEIILKHENPDIKEENELYVPEPYTDVYVYYLEAQIDKNNTEYDRYSNHMALFNAAYDEYAVNYNQTHKPISHGRFRV